MSLPKPYYQDDSVTIYHGDCREILPSLPKVDLVLTDPPYGTGWVSGGGKVGEFNPKRCKEEWDVWSLDWIDGRRCAFFGPFSKVKEMRKVCWSILWWKKTNPRPLGPDIEPIGLTRDYLQGIYECYNGDTPYHPCQKPIELIYWLMQIIPNSKTILDPYMGSGTTLRAAKDLGRCAIGIEIDELYCEIAAKRMAQEVLQFA